MGKGGEWNGTAKGKGPTQKGGKGYRLVSRTDISKRLWSARPGVSDRLNAVRDCPEPRITRGFALLPPDCDFGADAENRVSEPLLLKTS